MVDSEEKAPGKPKRRKNKTPRKKAGTPHDASYKRFFSSPVMVRDLLEGFIAGEWLKRLDLGSLEPVPKSFVSHTSRQRHSDVIWRMRSRKGREWIYLYLLIEFESRSQTFMVVRLMSYVGLLLEALSQLPEYRRRGARLPPVLPVVLYNGKARWRKAVALSEVLEPLPGELGAYQPEFRYLLIDEGSLSRERLEAMRNLVALLFRLETSAGAADAAAGLVALNEQLVARGTPDVELAFDLWLEQVLVPRFPEVNVGAIRDREGKAMLAQSLDKWIGDARQEGRREGQKELLLDQLEQRFAPLPDRVIRRVRAIRSKARISELAKKVLEAKSLAELGLG